MGSELMINLKQLLQQTKITKAHAHSKAMEGDEIVHGIEFVLDGMERLIGSIIEEINGRGPAKNLSGTSANGSLAVNRNGHDRKGNS